MQSDFEKSLAGRLASIETTLASVATQLVELRTEIASQRDGHNSLLVAVTRNETKICEVSRLVDQHEARRWQLIMAMAGAMLSVVASGLAIMLGWR